MTDARFEACLPYILREEGGNDDDPNDHGGRTSRGITQREYDKWRAAHGQPTRDVWTASDKEVHDIYYEKYWLPRSPHLHPGVDLIYFNIAVNAGQARAEKILMASIGSTDDRVTIDRFDDHVMAFYRGLAQFPRYGNGWTAREGRIHTAALRMATDAMKAAPARPVDPPKPPTAPVTPQTLPPVPAHVPDPQDDHPSFLGTLWRRIFFQG